MEQPSHLGGNQHLIVVDYREAASPVPMALRQLPSTQVVFRQLAVGDYIVDGRCVFERKTVVDFAHSVQDGRLFEQARKLVSLAQPAAIILEGSGKDLVTVGMRREMLQGAMISLSLVFRLPVLRALDAEETARLMVYASRQLQRREAGIRIGHRPKPCRRHQRQLSILQALPGIGPDRAERLLQSFGSVGAVMSANREQLQQVEGIGAATAGAIRDVLQASARA